MSADSYDDLLDEFAGLVARWPKPRVLACAVLHVGLGRIAEAIAQHEMPDGRLVKDAIDEVAHELRNR